MNPPIHPVVAASRESAAFSEARELQWMWKSPAMAAMAVAVCKLALARGAHAEFSANDLPEFGHGGQGIAGSVFYRLLHDEIVYQVGHFGSDLTFYPKVVKNKGGNKVNVYRLKSAARAEALLRVHDSRALTNAATEFKQAELAGT